jgi:hypothetical protein
MSEMREYQQKMLNSKSEIVFCNWERGKGKTEAIFEKMIYNILKARGNLLYVSQTVCSNNIFRNKMESFMKEIKQGKVKDNKFPYLCNIMNEYIEDIDTNKNNTHIKLKKDNEYTNIIYSTIDDILKGSIRGCKLNIVFFDECIPTSDMIKNLKELGVKQIIIMTTLFEDNNEVEFITDYESFDKSGFYDKQIEELMIEFEKIPKTEKTTITREKILDMIEKLQRMKTNKK